MTIFQPGFTLRIQHPILSEEHPGNLANIIVVEPKSESKWKVTLSRAKDFLKVTLKMHTSDHHYIDCSYVHVVPMNGDESMPFECCFKNTGIPTLSVPTKTVEDGDRHGFYLVQSRTKQLPSFFYDPTINKPTTLPACSEKVTTATLEATISVHAAFPQVSWFYIKSKVSGLVLDIDHGFGRDHTSLGCTIGLNHQKQYSSSACHPLLKLQLWRFEDGYIVNCCTGLVLDVCSFNFNPGATLTQWSRNGPENNCNQQWAVSDGFIHPKTHPHLVLDINDTVTNNGTCVCLGKRDERNILNQQWSFESVTFSWKPSHTSYTFDAESDDELELLNGYRSARRACDKANQTDQDLEAESRIHQTTARLMKDISTMDVALTFGINGGARNIALWAHRSVLEQESGLAKLLSKLKAVEKSSAISEHPSGVQSYHVTEYSLEAYCSLIRFLYFGHSNIQVNLDDFAIGSPPTKPFSFLCKERPQVDG